MTIVVALNESNYINQLMNAVTEPFYYHGRRVIIHNDPLISHNEQGVPFTNFDVLINCDIYYYDCLKPKTFCDITNHHHIPHYNKYVQSVYFNKLDNVRKLKFSAPCTINDRIGKHNIQVGAHWSKMDYVIKVLYGARGIGQVLVKNKGYDVGIDPATVASKFDLDTTDFYELIDKFPGRIIYNTQGEISDNEGMIALVDGDWYVQEYVDNIKHEIRVITDHKGGIGYMQVRAVKDETDYKQAIGSDIIANSGTGTGTLNQIQSMFSQCTTVTHVNNDFNTKIENILSDLIKIVSKDNNNPLTLANCSFDFFIDSKGDIGILEMSTQYGTMGIPREIVVKLNQEYIRAVISNYINYPLQVY